LLTDQDKMSKIYGGPSIDASYQVSVHLAIILFLEQELLTLPSLVQCIVSGARTAYSSVSWPLYCLWSNNCAVIAPETMQWPKDGRVSSSCSRDNTMAKRWKSKQFLLLWSNNCLLFRLLASVLSLEQELFTLPSFGHCIVS
jgi:hypothetical protein